MKIDYSRVGAGGTALILAGLLGALAGCGGGEPREPAAALSTPAAAPAAPAEPADATKPCTLLNGAAVGQVFGTKPATPTPQPTQTLPNGVDAYICQYRSTVGPIGALTVSITDGSVTPAQVIEAMRQKRPDLQPVAGVGEAAGYYVDQSGKTAVVGAAKARRGQTVIVSYLGSTRASQQQLAALVKQAIDVA